MKRTQPIVYIIGPLRGPYKEINISLATDLARFYYECGYAVICPHLNGGVFDGIMDDTIMLASHRTLLMVSDLIAIINVPWLCNSSGSSHEISLARTLKKTIIYHKPQKADPRLGGNITWNTTMIDKDYTKIPPAEVPQKE